MRNRSPGTLDASSAGCSARGAIAIVSVVGGLAAGRVQGGLAAVVVTIVLMLVAKRALALDDRDLLGRKRAQRILSRYGTHFAGVDVARANFTGTVHSVLG